MDTMSGLATLCRRLSSVGPATVIPRIAVVGAGPAVVVAGRVALAEVKANFCRGPDIKT